MDAFPYNITEFDLHRNYDIYVDHLLTNADRSGQLAEIMNSTDSVAMQDMIRERTYMHLSLHFLNIAIADRLKSEDKNSSLQLKFAKRRFHT